MKLKSINFSYLSIILLLLLCNIISPVFGICIEYNDDSLINDDTEYWALIVGVGEYRDHPEKSIGSIVDAENMYNALLSDERWHSDHIKVIKGKNATKINIFKGFSWLKKNEGKNDVVLVYFSTHGNNLKLFDMPIDIPPFDEKDRSDEILTTYNSFKFPLIFLSDDEISRFLGKLESKTQCVIIDSCHAGGFDDPPKKRGIKNIILNKFKFNQVSYDDFKIGFTSEISKEGRIVIMATEEHEVGWANNNGGCFTVELLKALNDGIGDFNDNGMISAEEAYKITTIKVRTDGYTSQHPTIVDEYPGELDLVSTNIKIDYYEDFEDNMCGWSTIDHTNEKIGNLWHITTNDYYSPNHCWSLCNEENNRYLNNINNSLVSPEITLGDNPVITFNTKQSIENPNDKLLLEVKENDWMEYASRKIWGWEFWTDEEIYQHYYPYWDLNYKTIQIRFRVISDDNIPFDPYLGEGYVMIDDVLIYSEKNGGHI